jgi:beta-aspartyl-peptidase (threonine type)
MTPAILIHGGCGRVDADTLADRLAGVRAAAARGWDVLSAGGSALDAVEAAVVVLEDLPCFNAGRGSVLNAEGLIETDAALMSGADLRAGAVAGLTGIANPIRLARRVMDASPHVLLCGPGAEAFARAQGFEPVDPHSLIVDHRRREWAAEHGTVGAVSADAHGRLAAATSTGGIVNKLPGRVGDTPLIGCGTYADARVAVSCTGHGEAIIRNTLARLAAFEYERHADLARAARSALAQLAASTGGDAGLILVDAAGHTAFAGNTAQMPVCTIDSQGLRLQA